MYCKRACSEQLACFINTCCQACISLGTWDSINQRKVQKGGLGERGYCKGAHLSEWITYARLWRVIHCIRILTAGQVAEIWSSIGFEGSVLVLNTFSNCQGQIKIKTDCRENKYVGESDLAWREHYVEPSEVSGEKVIDAKCCQTYRWGYIVPLEDL